MRRFTNDYNADGKAKRKAAREAVGNSVFAAAVRLCRGAS